MVFSIKSSGSVVFDDLIRIKDIESYLIIGLKIISIVRNSRSGQST